MFVLLKVANLKKESQFHWYKVDTEIIPDVKPDLGSGVCKLPIKEVNTLCFSSLDNFEIEIKLSFSIHVLWCIDVLYKLVKYMCSIIE